MAAFSRWCWCGPSSAKDNVRARGNSFEKLRAVNAMRGGRYAEAVQHLTSALQYRSDDPQARTTLGLAYAAQGQLSAASKEFDEAMQQWPDYAPAHFGKGSLLLLQNRQADALAPLAKAIELQPTMWEAYRNSARVLRSVGRLAEATAFLAEAEEVSAGRELPEDLRK